MFLLQNERLCDEREQYCKLLLKQSREFEKKNLSADKVGKEHVMAALQEKWEACKQEDKNLEGLCSPFFKRNYDHSIHIILCCIIFLDATGVNNLDVDIKHFTSYWLSF